jgi:hypothetical protein
MQRREVLNTLAFAGATVTAAMLAFASRSHKAQSSALRVPPGGSSFCRASRPIPASI